MLHSKRKTSNMRGMTLLEIMIVIGIIGALGAFLYPKVIDNMNKSKIKQTKLSIDQIVQSIIAYNIDCNKNPSSLEFLVKNDPECPNWGPDPYMRKVPKDEWGREFTYEVSDGKYVIRSPGYKGKEITSEDQ